MELATIRQLCPEETPSCPALPPFSNGRWECTGQSCFSICKEGFRLAENSLKFSHFTCSCAENRCLWKQRNSILGIAARKFPNRLLSPLSPRSAWGLREPWDLSIFRSEIAIVPKCISTTSNNAAINSAGNVPHCPALPIIQNGHIVCTAKEELGSNCRLVCEGDSIAHTARKM